MKSNDEKAYQVDEMKKHYNEKQLSRSVMIDMFFNDINVIKYDVVLLHINITLFHNYLTIKTSWKIICWIFINSIFAFSKLYDDYNRQTKTSMRKNMFTISFHFFSWIMLLYKLQYSIKSLRHVWILTKKFRYVIRVCCFANVTRIISSNELNL